MSKRGKLVLVIVLAVIVALIIWSQVPRNLSQVPRNLSQAMEMEPSQVKAVDIYLLGLTDKDSYKLTLSPEDPAFSRLWDLLDSKGYVPMVSVNIPQALPFLPVGSHGTRLDYDIYLLFLQKDRELSPDHVNMDGWEGIYLNHWYYRTSDSLAFQQEVLDLLIAQDPEPVPSE